MPNSPQFWQGLFDFGFHLKQIHTRDQEVSPSLLPGRTSVWISAFSQNRMESLILKISSASNINAVNLNDNKQFNEIFVSLLLKTCDKTMLQRVIDKAAQRSTHRETGSLRSTEYRSDRRFASQTEGSKNHCDYHTQRVHRKGWCVWSDANHKEKRISHIREYRFHYHSDSNRWHGRRDSE